MPKNPGLFIAAPVNSTLRERVRLIAHLSKLARDLGYPAHRGKRGSIYQLLDALVRGEVKIVKVPPKMDNYLNDAEMRKLFEETESLCDGDTAGLWDWMSVGNEITGLRNWTPREIADEWIIERMFYLDNIYRLW